uniref:Uncharacterized protein n=1 Tax=Oryza brachyantha TaxID=4533 RepID=J3KZL6_ORYBR
MPPGPLDLTKRSQYVTVDKQLLLYFKKSSSGIIFPMLLGFLPIAFCRGTRNPTIAFSFFALLCLVLNTAPLLFAGKLRRHKCTNRSENPEGGDQEVPKESDRRHIRGLCVAAFVSNIVLMVTAACLTAVLNISYLYLAAPVVLLIGAPYVYHIEHSLRNSMVWGVLQYEELQDDLKYFFDVSSEVTQAAFLGLPAMLFSQLRSTNCKLSVQVRAPEVLTMYTVLFGLFTMLVCLVPMGADFIKARERFVKVFIRCSSYVLLALIAVVATLAAMEILQGYVVLAFVFMLGACIWGLFWKECRTPRPSEKPSSSPSGGSETGSGRDAVVMRSRSLVWFGFCPAIFGVLMASYSRSVSDGGADISKLYKTCVFFMYVALISNLGRMLLVHEVHEDDGAQDKPSILLVSGVVNVCLMAVTVFLVVLMALLQPQQIQNTFVLA